MKQKFSIAMSLAVILAMLVTAVALADDLTIDNDTVSPGNQNIVNLTAIPGATVNTSAQLLIDFQGSRHLSPNSSLTLGVVAAPQTTLPAGYTVSNVSTSVPSNWNDNTDQFVAGISNISFTAPSSAGSYTYTVKWDDVAKSCTSTGDCLTGGAAFTISLTVSDPADNTLPTITASATKADSTSYTAGTWTNQTVTVHYNCTDSDSGVASVTGDQAFNADGVTASTSGTCIDKAGNSASTSFGPINIDKTAPINVNGAPNRAPDSGTWYNHAVDVVFTGTDATSGIASCTTTTYSSPDGNEITVNGSCIDNAGNSANGVSSAFNYDGTGPTGVVLSVTAGTPGSNGWYTSDVTVHTASDSDISGVTCTPDQFQTDETTDAVFNGSCTNGAGLSTVAKPLTVKLDKTGPSAVLSATGTLGTNDWYISDVTIQTTGTDSISNPTTCTANQSQTTDTTGQDFNGSCANEAGLSTNATTLTIKRDVTAPGVTVTAAHPADFAGWYNAPVVFDTTGIDATSGVSDANCSADQNYTGPDGMSLTVGGSCTDNAGNVGNGTSAAFDFDDTNPVVTVTPARAADHNGWYNAAVAFDTTGTDGTSDLLDTNCSANQNYTGPDGTGLTVGGSCTDNAGNTSSGTSATFNFDDTNPVVSLVGGPANGGTYYFGFVPAAPTCSASDALSGIDGSCSVSGYSNAVGGHTVTATATDKAGNTSSSSVSYTVSAWTLKGFYAPVDMGIHNLVKGGATVPLKFEIFAGPTELTNTGYIQTFTQKISCTAGAGDDIEQYATGGTSLRYDTTSGQFIFNWQTVKSAGSCYRVTMKALDGSTISADFTLK
jgi:hypothetical protein